MKIGIFTDIYNPLLNGVTTSINSLKQGLESLGYEIYIITTQFYSCEPTKEKNIIRIKGIRLPLKNIENFYYVLNYKKHLDKIRKLNLDLIHIQTEFSIGSLGIYLSKKLKLPLVYTSHTMYDVFIKYNNGFLIKIFRKIILKYFDYLLKKFINNADIVIVPTLKIFNIFTKKYKIEDKCKVIATGIDLKKFQNINSDDFKIKKIKYELELKNDFICLYVGRISKEKKIDFLLESFSIFCSICPNSKFLIIGDGDEKKKLQKKYKKLNLNKKIFFLGFIENDLIGLYYKLGNVFLSASSFETQGLTILEALASSVPVLAFYDSAFDKIIKDDENGFFYYSQEQLIRKLVYLYSNRDKFKKLILNQDKLFFSYSIENFVLNISEIYKKIILTNKNKIE
ncbi:glycosyltransferase [Candidatus Phytoplasma sacchari]|uniref:Glycosyltransferase n=1 Tax=Candidatus Phytoplasma sacchari TaxID=2609813 RepID=A0ABY7M162_9MOLU|nr:glycosyltransferase [Candidatus Phytoplasma sacchari]